MHLSLHLFFFFFNDTATTEIYTLSLHDALPISRTEQRRAEYGAEQCECQQRRACQSPRGVDGAGQSHHLEAGRSEEHTSELQSQSNLVCRLLLEKKKKQQNR